MVVLVTRYQVSTLYAFVARIAVFSKRAFVASWAVRHTALIVISSSLLLEVALTSSTRKAFLMPVLVKGSEDLPNDLLITPSAKLLMYFKVILLTVWMYYSSSVIFYLEVFVVCEG
jgi:hypothetical protein